MAASIRYLLETATPKCIIGSHFKELQNPLIVPRAPNFQFLQMNYLVQQLESNDEAEIVFLYTYAV